MLEILVLCFATYKTYIIGVARWEKEKDDLVSDRIAYLQNEDDYLNPELQQSLMMMDDSSVPSVPHSVSDTNSVSRLYAIAKQNFGRTHNGSAYYSGYYSECSQIRSVFRDRDIYDISTEQSYNRAVNLIVEETNFKLPYRTFAALGTLWLLNAALKLLMQLFDECDWPRLVILTAVCPLLLGGVTILAVEYVSRYVMFFIISNQLVIMSSVICLYMLTPDLFFSLQIEKPWTVLDSDLDWRQVREFQFSTICVVRHALTKHFCELLLQ